VLEGYRKAALRHGKASLTYLSSELAVLERFRSAKRRTRFEPTSLCGWRGRRDSNSRPSGSTAEPVWPWLKIIVRDTEKTTISMAIMTTLRPPYRILNIHYEAAWSDTGHDRHCMHEHQTLIEAAMCAMPNGPGWYVFAVDDYGPRQLSEKEDRILNELRFGPEWAAKH
jgi:hypothetical protein